MMKIVVLLPVIAIGMPALAQDPDSARPGIHQLEADEHRWDVLRTDPAVPALARGKAFAREGRYDEATKEFRKAVKTRRTAANFNLGVLFYEQGRYVLALKYLDIAKRAKRDSVVLEYYFNAKRLAKGSP
jgi:tetratricopeptide (TPR) repeat protein